MTSPSGISKMNQNYQISIPPEIRTKLDLKVGDYIAFILDGEQIQIKKVTV